MKIHRILLVFCALLCSQGSGYGALASLVSAVEESLAAQPAPLKSQSLSIVKPTNGILYVRQNATGDGSSWDDALGELAEALKWADENKVTYAEQWDTTPLKIYVAKGTYKPMFSPQDGANRGTNQGRDNTFLLVKDVQLFGGFPDVGHPTAAERDWKANPTVLSGDFGEVDVVTGWGSTLNITKNTQNVYHVVVSAGEVGSALLDGFTIRGGNANGFAIPVAVNGQQINRDKGGGLYSYKSSPILTQVAIIENSAKDWRGGMFQEQSSVVLTRSIVAKNWASYGAGLSIVNDLNVPSILTQLLIVGNRAVLQGGGLHNSEADPRVTQVLFTGNSAVNTGGAIHNMSGKGNFTNVTLVNNGGHGLYAYGYTFWKNCIIWDEITNSASNYEAEHSLFKGLLPNGTGNIDGRAFDIEDIFADITADDYTLKAGSPAIDAGNNAYVTMNRDLAAKSRIRDSRVDMGAYEYQKGNSVMVVKPDQQNILYVRKGGAGDGSSWHSPLDELAEALKWADENEATYAAQWEATPLQIYVAEGAYKPMYSPEDGPNRGTDQGRDNTFLLVRDVQIFGGFPASGNPTVGDRDWEAIPTILSADIDNNDALDGTINGANAYHVVMSLGDVGKASLDGFTIRGGNANDGWNSLAANGVSYISQDNGGGMYNAQSSPALANVTISGNTANGGGGMFNDSSSPSLKNVTISGNRADQDGGGMYNISSSPALTHVAISGNRANQDGGGMYNYGSSPSLTHVTISGNNSAYNGGGMYNRLSSFPKINNSIIYGNLKGTAVSNIYNYIWAQQPIPIFRNSLVQGEDWDDAWGTDDGTNKITSDDPFVNAVGGDYRPKAGGAAIDIGDNALLAGLDGNTKDLAGGKRLVGCAVDAGAYENQEQHCTVLTDGVVYVNKAVVGGAGSGESWENAMPELADALKWADDNKATYAAQWEVRH